MLDYFLQFINDNQDTLGWLFDALSWLFGSGVIIGVYKLITWLIKEYRLRKNRTTDNFPFKVILPNSNVAKEILGGADDDLLADRNIPYQQRVHGQNTRRELEELIEDNRWILVTGRTGLGKTREALQLAQSLNNEGWTILSLTRESWLDAPAKLPNNVPERKLVFFLDDLNKKCYSSIAEIRPNIEESLTLPIKEEFQIRLERTLEAFDAFCGKSEVRVIATVRNERISDYDEPSEWEKLSWEKFYSLWGKFKLIDLPEPDDNAEQLFIFDMANKANVYINSDDIPMFAKRNDGTFRNLLENLIYAKTEGSILTSDNFRDTLKGTWLKRYKKATQKYPEAKFIYDAIELLQSSRINIKSSTVLEAAYIISSQKMIGKFLYKLNYFFVLRKLLKSENILYPRDGQIESKGYKIDLENYLPLIYKLMYWQRISGMYNLNLVSRLPYYFSGLSLNFIPMSILVPSKNITPSAKLVCLLLGLSNLVYQIGLAYRESGFPLFAEHIFLKEIELISSNRFIKNNHSILVSWSNLGSTYASLNRYEDAISAYKKAIEINPKYANPWNELAEVYVEQEKYEDAISAYKKAIEINPKYTTPWNGLAEVYVEQEKYEDAISAYEKAIELDSKSIAPWVGLGSLYERYDNYKDATSAYIKAIELEPTSAAVMYYLGYLHRNFEHYDEAIEAFQKAIELDNSEPGALWNGLGNIYYDSGKFEDALYAYKKAIQLDADEGAAIYWGNIGTLFLINEKIIDAKDAFNKSRELDPKYVYSILSLALCHKKSGNIQEAEKLLDEAELLITNQIEYVQACFQAAKGRIDDSLNLLKIGLRKNNTSKAWARKDPNFENIRGNSHFKELVGQE